MRHPIDDAIRELYFERGRHAKARAVAHGPFECIQHHRRRMAEHERPARQHVVDVLVAINIPYPRALSARNHERLATNTAECAHWRIHTTRKSCSPARHNVG